MTPYSGKYAGYTIQRGKFSLEGEYKIVARKIDTQSRIFLDQFTFGERVESPDATKLPVRLAVALLKDRKGEIRLDLPVSGSLDDPKFRSGEWWCRSYSISSPGGYIAFCVARSRVWRWGKN
jgi:hypothetical protein